MVSANDIAGASLLSPILIIVADLDLAPWTVRVPG